MRYYQLRVLISEHNKQRYPFRLSVCKGNFYLCGTLFSVHGDGVRLSMVIRNREDAGIHVVIDTAFVTHDVISVIHTDLVDRLPLADQR